MCGYIIVGLPNSNCRMVLGHRITQTGVLLEGFKLILIQSQNIAGNLYLSTKSDHEDKHTSVNTMLNPLKLFSILL